MKGPMNGWAYTPIELEAIWEMPLDINDVIEARTPIYEFHFKASAMRKNPQRKQDTAAYQAIVRDTLAQVDNRTLPEPPPWPCTIHYNDGSPKPESSVQIPPPPLNENDGA